MRIITMQRLTLDGKPVYPEEAPIQDWWCVIETEEEKLVYELAFDKGNEECKRVWNEMIKHAGQDMGVSWGDDDVYGYISPNEHAPEIKENFKDGEGDVWVRVQ